MLGLIGEFGASGQTWLAGGGAEQHPVRRQDSNQDNQTLTKYRKNKRDFHHSSTDHPRVTKRPAPCHHGEILRHSALTIHLFALAPTTCATIPRIRATGILAPPSGESPLEWGEGFDGVSRTGQPVAHGLPAADLWNRGKRLQMSQYLLDHHRTLNAGNHLHRATAFTAGRDIDIASSAYFW